MRQHRPWRFRRSGIQERSGSLLYFRGSTAQPIRRSGKGVFALGAALCVRRYLLSQPRMRIKTKRSKLKNFGHGPADLTESSGKLVKGASVSRSDYQITALAGSKEP